MKFRVIRKDWYRGRGSNGSALVVKKNRLTGEEWAGKKCCLGFLAQACGVSTENMDGVGEPCELLASDRALMPAAIVEEVAADGRAWNTDLTRSIIEVNDNRKISDEQREQTLTGLFRQGGIEVEFVDE